MFLEVRDQFPENARVVEAAYGHNSNLNFGDGTILSTTGTHQGCPLAPLLRNCFALPKFYFALHTVDTSRHPAVLEEFDSSIKEAVEGILGAPLPRLQYDQATLPIPMGGLGLRRAKQHGSAAYLASVGDAATMVQEIRLQLLVRFPNPLAVGSWGT